MNRRNFLRNTLVSAMAGAYGTSLLATGPLLASSIGSSFNKVTAGYKALVCVFLYGGNDGFNMVVPRDPLGYGNYQTSRQNLAIAQNELLPITPRSGGDYGFHPSMPDMQSLFAAGDLAIQANIGTLVEPVTRAQIQAKNANLPPQLFSHNSQQALWETAYASESASLGWGGLLADRLGYLNSSLVPMNVSITGNNLFQVGENHAPYAMNASGPDEMIGVRHSVEWEQYRAQAFDRIRDMQSNHILEQAHKDLTRSTQSTAQLLGSSLETAPVLTTPFPEENNLADQLAMVAKMISVSEELGFERQIFIVGMGGFDTHDRQNQDQPNLLGGLSQALAAFNQATQELGVANQVTSFTHSDFGRTLTSNGDGTDHGWGSHHLMMGGAVNGGDIYGTMPELSIGGPDDADDGRMIPTTSVEQYSATLARWFGLPENELNTVFPNLGNFSSADLGFMQS